MSQTALLSENVCSHRQILPRPQKPAYWAECLSDDIRFPGSPHTAQITIPLPRRRWLSLLIHHGPVPALPSPDTASQPRSPDPPAPLLLLHHGMDVFQNCLWSALISPSSSHRHRSDPPEAPLLIIILLPWPAPCCQNR